MGKIRSSFYSEQLNKIPLKDVEQRISLYKRILQRELRRKGVSFDFHIWVSDDWFCPDGVPGFAIPFYLFHPELLKIEKQEIGYVEGCSEKQILKLMRHELGHCIDNAFRLRKNKLRQEIFGSHRIEYPDFYTPKKYSKSFVHYLGDNYAQSHPDEDFAETFAVWLDPQSCWENRYKNTPAFKKLVFMKKLMREVGQKKSKLKNKNRVDPIERIKKTLKEHYFEKRSRLGLRKLDRIDRELKVFSNAVKGPGPEVSVSSYLREERKKLCKRLALETDSYQYHINYVITKTIERAQKMQITMTKEQLREKTPLLIEKNFRYLKEKRELRFYL